MAWTLQLLDSTTTIDLNDGTAYSARALSAPVPGRRISAGGVNLMRHGSDLTHRVFNNRTVVVALRINGTSQDNLIANINAIHSLLERGAEYSVTGLGSQLKLRRKWQSATNQVDFHVIEGTLQIGNEFSAVHAVNNTIMDASLTLVCEPFAYGAEESIENFVADAGFEISGTALADWTESKTGSGTTARDTDVYKNGEASLKLVMTSSSDGQVIERNQALADVDAAEIWSFGCAIRIDALSDCKVTMHIDYNTGTDVEVSSTTVNASAFVSLVSENLTVPGSVTSATLKLRLEATDASATGIVYFDDVIAVQASSLPTAWASSHTIGNHNDMAAQAHSCFLDVENMPGDVPALLQVRLAEGQSHDEMWIGARHSSRQYDTIWIEGEDSDTDATLNTITNWTLSNSLTDSDAAHSAGNAHVDRMNNASGVIDRPDATYFRHDYDIATPPSGQYRVLVGGSQFLNNAAAGRTVNASNYKLGFSYTYGGFTLLSDTAPDASSFVAFPAATIAEGATSNRDILDLGMVTIPPIETPDNQTAATFTLKIFVHYVEIGSSVGDLSAGQYHDCEIDFICLMPVDYGAFYVSKADAADVILLDAMSETKGMYILNASNVVQSFPSNQLGIAPEAHPNGTRIYFLAQDDSQTIADTFTVSITYRPRFLHVQGA
jgi:hypothetical protein